MPAKTNSPSGDENRLYPNLERFIETNDREATARLFEETKSKLREIASGAKGPAAKKALAGIEQVEALLSTLHDVRERLEKEARAAKKSRR
ncbi:MAG: hypothetical protein ACOX6T_05655 [Myxococcales bacterium]|jgi:hypothetical protein